MTGSAEDMARRSLRELHKLVATFPVAVYAAEIRRALPRVPEAVLRGAWDPDSKELLTSEIYLAIVRACRGDDEAVGWTFALYTRALLARDALESGLALEQVDRVLDALARPPEFPEPARIRTTQQLLDYLRSLVERSGLTLREIQDVTAARDPEAVTCRSTLSDAFRHGQPPRNERVVRVLLTVLFARIGGLDADSPAVARRVDGVVRVWQRVLYADPGK